MDLVAIRAGIGLVLAELDDVRVYDSIPEALAASGATALVVAAGEPYVTYSEAAGLVSKNEVRMRVVIVPPQQMGAGRILAEIDALLGCGSEAPRSIRTLLGSNISANGTACAVTAQTANVRTITINDFTNVVGELDLLIKARC